VRANSSNQPPRWSFLKAFLLLWGGWSLVGLGGAALRSLDFSESKVWAAGMVDGAWTIDTNGREAHSLSEPATPLVFDPAGSEKLLGNLFGEHFPPEQLVVAAVVVREGLRAGSARKPTLSLPRHSTPRLRSQKEGTRRAAIRTCVAGDHGGVFNLCLFPVTWAVLRLTVFPREGRSSWNCGKRTMVPKVPTTPVMITAAAL
jgi:hypothetical protein